MKMRDKVWWWIKRGALGPARASRHWSASFPSNINVHLLVPNVLVDGSLTHKVPRQAHGSCSCFTYSFPPMFYKIQSKGIANA
jgi:hypothetical protein